MDPIEILNLALLLLLMFGLGTTLETEQLVKAFRRPKGVSIGLLSQFVLMPPIGWAVATMLKLDKSYAVGLVVMTCCPGGAISNMLCLLVKADVTLSVSMTAASSVAACFMLPLNLYIWIEATGLADGVKLQVVGIVLSALVVVVGTFGGLWMGSRLGRRSLRVVEVVSSLSGVVLIGVAFAANAKSKTPSWEAPRAVVLASMIPVFVGALLGLVLARLVARLEWPSSVAVGIETSVQNKLVALAVLSLTFDGDRVARDAAYLVPILYAVFATFGNLIWAIVAWKLGLTNLDRSMSCVQLAKRPCKTEPAGSGRNLEHATLAAPKAAGTTASSASVVPLESSSVSA